MLSLEKAATIAMAQPARAAEPKDRWLEIAPASAVALPVSGRPEARLLVACARTNLDSVTARQIDDLLQGEIDWEYVCRKAHQHCVTPLLYRSLSKCHPDAVPEGVLSRLRDVFRDNARYTLFRTRELLKLLRLFESSGIPAVSFKGPLLAAQAYGNLGLRQFSDLDILVHKRDVSRVHALLLSDGYRLAKPFTWTGRVIPALASSKDLIFVHDEKRIVIELHWRLTNRHFNLPLDMKSFWQRLVPVSFAGTVVRNLPLEDLILYLCMHGARHGWERLAWICDVAELVRIHPEIDWDNLMNRGSTLGGERMLALGLLLASDLLGANLPADVSERIKSDPKARLVATRVRDLLFQEEANLLDISYWYQHHLLVRERFRDRARLYLHYCRRYLHLAVTPNERDHELRLPASLSFLYYPLRPIRLTRVYGLSMCKGLVKRTLRKIQL